MTDIEISPYNNLLVYKKEYTPDFVFKIIKERELNGLRIFSILKEQRLESISFLSQYTFLEQLDITALTDFDFDFLPKLPNLKKLSINIEGNKEIDCSALNKLEYLSIQWRRNVLGLNHCTNIRSLCLIDFKENDLSKINSLKKLKELRIKTSSIRTLEGVDRLKEIESIAIGNCKKLIQTNNLNGLDNLKYLEFDTCPHVKDFSTLKDLPNLESLILSNCNKIESIEFVEKFPHLSSLGLLGDTEVIDGNLMPAKGIKSVVYKHRKHYNIKISNEVNDERYKENMRRIKNIIK